MLFGKTKKIIENQESIIKLDLSNNYRDSAYQSYLEYVKMIEDLRNEGKINDKDFEKLNAKIEEYKAMLKK